MMICTIFQKLNCFGGKSDNENLNQLSLISCVLLSNEKLLS